MKTLSYGFIFLLSAVLTVACGGGGGAGGAGTVANSTVGEVHINNLISLSAAFITVSF
jgi:hypothetical protein